MRSGNARYCLRKHEIGHTAENALELPGDLTVQANSTPVHSSQTQPHPKLQATIARHLQHVFRREPSAAGRRAFTALGERLLGAAFVLDAGCGTGDSTVALARVFPDRLVIGVDKSAARLVLGQRRLVRADAPQNAILLRCELVDFWQLAVSAGLRCSHQFLLYPNPWPKPEQFKRRWPAHPILPAILALGGEIELRTNWRVYAQEFATALRLGGRSTSCEAFVADLPLSPFERKYAASGHPLWRCRASLGPTPES